MKIKNVFLTFFFAFLFLSTVTAYAEAPDFGQSLLGLISAIKLGAIGGILLAVGQLLKSNLVAGWIGAQVNSKFIPWITTFIGVLISVGQDWGSKPIYISIIEGIVAGLISNGVFDHTKAVS